MGFDIVEKRKYARIDLRSRINFTIKETDGDGETLKKKFHALGKNIGAEGLLFNSDIKLEPGTVLDMEILFPDKTDPVFISGEVCWCRKEGVSYDTGVRFFNIDKNHVLLLVKYVCGNLEKDITKRLGA